MPENLRADEHEALLTYARSHGRGWKSALLSDWAKGRATGALQRLRNTRGPSWLAKVKVDLNADSVRSGGQHA